MKYPSLCHCVSLLLLFARGSNGCFNYNRNISRNIKSGDTFYQDCVCTEKDQSVDNLKWYDPQGQEITILNGPGTQSVVFTEKSGHGISLYISYVSKSRSGTYSCVADFAGEKYVQNFHIRAYDPLYFVDPEKNQFISKGQSSLIKCQARGETDPVINWYKLIEEDQIQILDDDKYETASEGLKLRHVDDGDAGRYRCTALVMETGDEEEQIITVEVLTKPFIEAVVAKPDGTVVVGDSLSIECIAIGVPTPEYVWNKTTEKNVNKALNWPKKTNLLEFKSVTAEDRGIYECLTSNRAGTAREQITIEVLIPPKIEAFNNVTGSEGSIIHIICNASGRPAPTINIIFEKEFDPTEMRVVNLNISETENSLVVSFLNLSRHYDGDYFCNASNEVATATATAAVTVQHQPYFNSAKEYIWAWIGRTVNLTCACESNPPAAIQWWYQVNTSRPDIPLSFNKNKEYLVLTVNDSSSYGIYKCIATNYLSNASKILIVTQAFVPSSVTNFTVLEVTASSVTFDIMAPTLYQGPDVIGFTAEYDKSSNYDSTNIHLNRSWALNVPFRIEKLKPKTSYQFKFAAINAMGTGHWSDAIEIETPEKSVPNQPTWLYDNNTKISDGVPRILKWNAPENNGEIVDLYYLQYCPFIEEELDEENCNILELASFKTEFDLSGILEGNKKYEILLAAHNAVGNSSGAQLVVTWPASFAYSESMSAQLTIGLSVVVVIVAIVILDLILFFWKRQGMIYSCYYKNKNKSELNPNLSRDKKGLLRDHDPSTADDTLKRTNGEKSYEYTRTTGIITGKHSSV